MDKQLEKTNDYTIIEDESILQISDPISLDIDDDELFKIVDKRVDDSKKWFDQKYNLTERRKKNECFLFGKQLDGADKDHKLKDYETRYLDNALYEIEASIKPIAMSKLPDMMVLPNKDDPEAKETAENITTIVDSDIKTRENRKTLGLAFKHLPVYFTGIIKARWNSEKNDFEFLNVHPNNIVVDHTCSTSNADDMKFICEFVPVTVQELLMIFPNKKEDFLKALHKNGVIADDKTLTYKEKATEIKMRELWFTWYDDGKKAEAAIKNESKKVNAVLWKYEDVIFKKIKNPNFDWEGYNEFFTYDGMTKVKVSDEELQTRMAFGDTEGITVEKIFRNYFDQPRKPYYFMGYDQWGKIPYDETSRIEQNLRNQENLDERGKSIMEKLKNKGKHIFSKKGGIKAEDVERMDMDNPKQDLLVDDDVQKVHAFIQPTMPTSQEFADLNNTRDRMYALAGASAVRGQIQSDVATTNQIAREADFTRADDLVEDTINAAAEWMAQWEMQFIKLRYTEEHFRKILGQRGVVTFIKLKNDMIEDGMEVMIKASGTDKLKAQKNAVQMAQLGAPFCNPLDFFNDMGIDDAEGRTERGLVFASNPEMYLMQFVKKQTIPQMADTLSGAAPQEQPQSMPVQPEQAQATPMDTTQIATQPQVLPEGSVR